MKKPIRVLEIISGFAIEGPLGGIERFGIELAQAIAGEEVLPIVCGIWAYQTPHENEWVEVLRQLGIDAFFAANWNEQSPVSSFIQAYKGTLEKLTEPVDIIHSHCQFGDVLALLLKRKLSAKKLVRTVHNEREWGKRPLRKLMLTNIIYPLSFQLELGVSQQVVDNLDQRHLAKWSAKKAVRSYNALNFGRFENIHVDKVKKRRELGISADDIVVGTVGRLSKQKGYSILLQAASIILKKSNNIYFLIVGTGLLEQELKDLATQLKISDKVIFLGARHDIEEIYAIMDLFINSSLWEGLPTVILEAMSANVPVIGTEVSGNTELIQDEETGWLVPPNNPQELASVINKVLSIDPNKKMIVCEQAKEFIGTRFSIHGIAKSHIRFYQRLAQ
ncbi:glycosyltransferase [Candidatus Leptofilum sp.]|uniref:glycosyltransferase n=1 Tax=Candidatus Leptofilum sp. TaxID=3241576 RepID=UPI003B5CD26B